MVLFWRRGSGSILLLLLLLLLLGLGLRLGLSSNTMNTDALQEYKQCRGVAVAWFFPRSVRLLLCRSRTIGKQYYAVSLSRERKKSKKPEAKVVIASITNPNKIFESFLIASFQKTETRSSPMVFGVASNPVVTAITCSSRNLRALVNRFFEIHSTAL